jgi:CheY-like chemotaxis protein
MRQPLVLIVDDEAQVRVLLGLVLKKRGFKVLEAVDGENALEIVQGCGGAIDAVVSDFDMPKMDGKRLIRHLKSEFPSIPVLLLSSQVDMDDLPLCDAVMTKPFVASELAATVRRLIEEQPSSCA